jgi:hypothetical protein
VAAYKLSVQAGNPLSERRLAQMFGRTSRRWARARIADARQALSIQESPGVPAMARLEALASELEAMTSRRCATGERAWSGERSGCGASVLRASTNQSPVTAVPAAPRSRAGFDLYTGQFGNGDARHDARHRLVPGFRGGLGG